MFALIELRKTNARAVLRIPSYFTRYSNLKNLRWLLVKVLIRNTLDVQQSLLNY